jgi:hypothetical protein
MCFQIFNRIFSPKFQVNVEEGQENGHNRGFLNIGSWASKCVFAICLIGAIWQIYQITQIYFSYPMTLDIELVKNRVHRFPASTVCINFLDAANLSKLEDEHKPFRKHVNRMKNLTSEEVLLEEKLFWRSSGHLNNLPVDVRERVTLNHSELFECTYSKQTVDDGGIAWLDEYELCPDPIATYFETFKCFTFFANWDGNSSQPLLRDVAAKRLMVDKLLTIYALPLLRNSSVYVMVHNDTKKFSLNGNYALLDMTLGDVFRVSYNRKAYYLMQPPYSTNCRTYESIGYTSRLDCREKCMERVAGKKNRWPTAVPAVAQVTINTTELRSCPQSLCRMPDCVDEYFSTKLERIAKEPVETQKKSIEISLPDLFETHYRYSAKLEMVEYLCYVGSTISMWFGFSIVGLLSVASVDRIKNII